MFWFALISDVGLDFEFSVLGYGFGFVGLFCLIALLFDLLVVCVSCFRLFDSWVGCAL